MISVRQLAFTYPGSARRVLHGLDFAVGHGEVFGFLGPSGAGKSTTQKILIGLLRGWSGDVSVLERDLAGWKSDDYARIGVSFEAPNHYLKLTARENLRYFAALYGCGERDPADLLGRVGLGEDGDFAVSQYSKGMKTRLGVVRALLHEPELLFLDEPTVGLDPVNARRIRELIREQRDAGRTVFLTTHDMITADELCDNVGLIVDGEIRAIGSPRQMKLEHGERRVRVEYRDESGRAADKPSGDLPGQPGPAPATAPGRDGLHTAEFALDTIGDDPGFRDLLRTTRVETIHTLEATLEDVFVKVTGRTLA